MKKAQDFTDDEKLAIIEKSNERTVKETAEEFGTSPETVTYLRYNYARRKGISIVKQESPVTDNNLRKLSTLTHEERLAVIRRAEEVGIPQTAKEFNISIRAVQYCRIEYAHKKGITVHHIKNIKIPKETEETAMPVNDNDNDNVNINNDVIENSVAETKDAQENLSVVINSDEKNTATAVFDDEKTALRMENALLKEKISSMSEQLKKLRTAVADLV